jgi:hypothetical protein
LRHKLSCLLAGLFSLALLATTQFAAITPVAAATLAATTTCSNGVNNAGGQGLICQVTIENTITAIGGSATVTVRECHGAAGDPQGACTIQVSTLAGPVTSVDQCNGSINGGGGTLRCSVQVRNTFVAENPSPVGATVNQCVGSGDGFSVGCDPFPATATGATITQCNGSANGGTLVQLTCTATGTQSDAFSVTINQCNGSGNGGGGLVICSANIDSVNAVPIPTAVPTAVPTGIPTAVPTAVTTALPSAAPSAAPSKGAGGVPTAAPSGGAGLVPTAGPRAALSTSPGITPGPSLPLTDTVQAPIVPTNGNGSLLALIVVSSAMLLGMSVLLRKQRA